MNTEAVQYDKQYYSSNKRIKNNNGTNLIINIFGTNIRSEISKKGTQAIQTIISSSCIDIRSCSYTNDNIIRSSSDYTKYRDNKTDGIFEAAVISTNNITIKLVVLRI